MRTLKVVLSKIIVVALAVSVFVYISVNRAEAAKVKTYHSLNAYVLDCLGQKYDDNYKLTKILNNELSSLQEATMNNYYATASELIKKMQKSKYKSVYNEFKKEDKKFKKEIKHLKSDIESNLDNSNIDILKDSYAKYINLRTKYEKFKDENEQKLIDNGYKVINTKPTENKIGSIKKSLANKDSTDYISLGLFKLLRRPMHNEDYRFVKDSSGRYNVPEDTFIYTVFNGIVADIKGNSISVASTKDLYIVYDNVKPTVSKGDVLEQNTKIGTSVGNDGIKVSLYYKGVLFNIERIFSYK